VAANQISANGASRVELSRVSVQLTSALINRGAWPYTPTLADSKKQLQSALRLIDFLPVNVAVFYCISKWSPLVELMPDNCAWFVQ